MTNTITLTNEADETVSFDVTSTDARAALGEVSANLNAIPGAHAWRISSFDVLPDAVPEPPIDDDPITPTEEQPTA